MMINILSLADIGVIFMMLLVSGLGVLMLMAALGKADWWFKGHKVQRLFRIIGEKATRVFIGVSGCLLFIMSILAAIFGDG